MVSNAQRQPASQVDEVNSRLLETPNRNNTRNNRNDWGRSRRHAV